MSLTPDQQEAYDSFVQNQITFISGPAGTGKSYLIKYIQSQLTEQQRPFFTLSSTGISAHHIGGMTVHSFLCRLKIKAIEVSSEMVLILDEISMLGKKIFESFEYSLRKFFFKSKYFSKEDGTAFGGIKIVMFGDFAQLPPVQDEFCFHADCWDTILATHELKTVLRQTDPEFQSFLSHIRTGKLTRPIREKLYSLSKRKLVTDTHLFLSNAEAEEFNRRGLDSIPAVKKSFEHLHQLAGTTNLSDLERFFLDRHQCYETLTVCVGAKCMLTTNLDVESGWCNGTLAIVESFTGDQIIIKNKVGQIMPITRKTYTRSKHTLESESEHKSKAKGRYDVNYLDDEEAKGADLITVHQFPLILAWGLTIHKSQGMSLPSCTISLPILYPPSLMYVALSRCMSWDTLCITSRTPIRYDQICPSTEVMSLLFETPTRTCKICQDSYVGPYAAFCHDCCSAPGSYTMYRFIDFIPEANPSPDMIQYMNYVLEHPDKGTTAKWKKFVAFCRSKM